MLQIARNIKLVRKTAGLTQPEFASKFPGVTTAMLKSYEGEVAKPDSLLIEEIAEYAGVSEQDLKNKKLSATDLDIKVEKVDKVDTKTRKTTEQAQVIDLFIINAKVDLLVDYVLKLKAEAHNRELKKVFDEFYHDLEQLIRKEKK